MGHRTKATLRWELHYLVKNETIKQKINGGFQIKTSIYYNHIPTIRIGQIP